MCVCVFKSGPGVSVCVCVFLCVRLLCVVSCVHAMLTALISIKPHTEAHHSPLC